MQNAELLLLLFIGHFVGDFILQTNSMAFKKKTSYPHLLAHVFVYTASLTVFALPAGLLNAAQIGTIFLGHAFIDRSTFVKWWLSNVNRSPDIKWLGTVVDQSWHLMLLMFVAYVL